MKSIARYIIPKTR